jgi:hypothetical protein
MPVIRSPWRRMKGLRGSKLTPSLAPILHERQRTLAIEQALQAALEERVEVEIRALEAIARPVQL